MSAFLFEPAELSAKLPEPGAYAGAEPFPHAVIDGLLPDAVLDAVLEEYPAPDSGAFHRFDDERQQKLAASNEAVMGPATRLLLSQFNSGAFVGFLGRLTGIEGLIPDPHLVGGGLHQIERGGLLEVHADFNRHPGTDLDRRLNVLVYLNRDWREEYGGYLELWDRTFSTCRRVAPEFNRTVVFSTTSFSYHGHPEPLACPPDRTRRSLALYYYSNGRPAEEIDGIHDTRFRP